MRILLVNESARVHTGGVHRMVVETCGVLHHAGHTVAVAYQDGGPSEVPCAAFQLPRNGPLADLRTALDKVLTEFRPEVVQLHQTQPPGFLDELSALVPTCRFVHDQGWFCSAGDRMAGDFTPCRRPHNASCLFWHYAQGCGGKSPLGNWRRWQMVQSVQGTRRDRRILVQVASEFMRQGLLENHYSGGQIDVVPLFAIPAKTISTFEPGLLLAASRLVPGKGVHFLLEALKALPPIPWQLALAGDGPQRPALEELSRQLGLQNQVRFLGELSVDDLEQWYARASMVVSPVLRLEPFGLVGVEAMAHGKPIVAFAGGGTDEWLVNGQTGIAVFERSPTALASAISDLLGRPARGQQLGAQARQNWERQYQPQMFVARLIKSFERCIELHRQSAPPGA